MTLGSRRKSSQQKVSEHRQRLREKGLRPIQLWVPDVRTAAFRKKAHLQSLAIATSASANDDQSFIDAVSELQLDEMPE